MAALKFKLGQCVITTNARDTLHPQDVPDSIVRHGQGDWGELCPEDREQNERAPDELWTTRYSCSRCERALGVSMDDTHPDTRL